MSSTPKPVARLLHWHGPAHIPKPHGGIAARTYAEFPAAEADKPDSYWKNGEPLYTLDVHRMARSLSDRMADACGVNRDDQWNLYGDEFNADVLAMLEAAQ